jgi:hypothetical protein
LAKHTRKYVFYLTILGNKNSENSEDKMLIENGAVNPVLLSLIQTCGLTVTDESPSAVSDLLQREWVKTKDGAFRAQIGGRDPTEGELGILSQLGFVNEIPINNNGQYTGTLVLGATLKAVTRRMWFIVREKFRSTGLHQDGFFHPIYSLGSSRPLNPDLEMQKHVPGIIEETGAPLMDWQGFPSDDRWPETEIDMMDSVARWLSVPGVFCFCAPDATKPDGSIRPANTDETILGFFNQDPTWSGYYLLVSSQPFCMNQLLAARRAVQPIRRSITFDVVGPAAPPMPLARWLDTIAKQLWEEVQLLPKS